MESINKMITSVDARKAVGKRLLSDDNDGSNTDVEQISKKIMIVPTTYVARKLENIMGDRRTQNQ